LNSDIVTGTGGFIRAWFGDVTPQGSGVWKNASGTNNWSANTAVNAGWGGVSGTVPGGTNNGPGFGKPGDAGQIATFDNTVTNYAGGNVNQDVGGLTIGGFNLSAQAGSNGYNIGTGTPGGATALGITLDNGSLNSDIKVNSGTHTIASPLTVIGKGLAVNTTSSADQVSITGGITATGTSAFTGATKGLTKDGAGKLILAGANNFSGATTVSSNGAANNKLEVKGSLAGTTAVNNSGTFILNSSTPANNIVGTGTMLPSTGSTVTGLVGTTGYTAGAGSSLQMGSGQANSSQSFASLTLSGNSTLDFGSSANVNLFFGSLFAPSSTLTSLGSFTLDITNYTNSATISGTNDTGAFGDGNTRLLFTTNPGFSLGTPITGLTINGGAAQAVQFGTNYELVGIVAVPEPATTALIGAVALCALIGYRERRRFTGVRSRAARK
jgi:autotransporter-associated beta strand protein